MNSAQQATEYEQKLLTLRAAVLDHLACKNVNGKHLQTALPWLSFIRFTEPTELSKGMLEPSMCLILQGQKKVLIGQEVTEYGVGSYLLTAIDMPIAGQVIQASLAQPYLGVRIDLDLKEMADTILTLNMPMSEKSQTGAATYVAVSDTALLDAFLRLVNMLDNPQELQVLATLVKQEIGYRLITAPEGGVFYQQLVSYYQGKGINEAIVWIRKNFANPLRMDELARHVGMSVSSLHHRFKATTVMSPLQYQKQIRLLEARRLLLSGKIDAATAAFRVGYESPSQFNREYRRSFGAPPLQDMDALRQQGIVL